MSVAIPSSIYTSLVLTESVSYFTSSVAVLVVLLAIERPSFRRQLAVIVGVGLAYATRVQFAALLPAFLGRISAPLGHRPSAPATPSGRSAAVAWTLSALVLGIAALAARRSLSGSSPGGGRWAGTEGASGVTTTSASVARFVVYHLAGLEMYLFVIPFVVAQPSSSPTCCVPQTTRGLDEGGCLRRSVPERSTPSSLLIAAAFASTPYGCAGAARSIPLLRRAAVVRRVRNVAVEGVAASVPGGLQTGVGFRTRSAGGDSRTD